MADENKKKQSDVKPRRERGKRDKLKATANVEQLSTEEIAKLNEALEAEIIQAIEEINSYPEKADFGL